jgi:hypothetical protein
MTAEQIQKLLDVLAYTDDCGPRDEGWKSSELTSAIQALEALLEQVVAQPLDT